MIQVGMIGAGMMGRVHAESLARLPEARLTLVADPSGSKLQEIESTFRVRTTRNSSEVIESSEIQAVMIATPTPLHYTWIRTALEAGKHVFCEIPLARQFPQGQELVRLAREKNLILTANHSIRGFYEFRALRDRVLNGSVGNPGVVRLSRRGPHPRNWYSEFEASGGVILDAMIHDLDFLLWTCGPATRVTARGMCRDRDVRKLDYALAVIRLASGAIAHVESSWCHYGQYAVDVEIAGDNGLLTYDNFDDSIPLRVSLIDWNSGGRKYVTESTILDTAYMKLLRGFLCAIEGTEENPVPPEQALASLQLALAVIDSARTGATVELPVPHDYGRAS
ncbi:MAG TPA: Gfo/Idh/MocA family oxidoreductase [bacterium]|nr:Gfo/Idh/MocA family oxidoreductase [bacterium]HQP99445.1 Gfo/Idh/MocA family oxidoreductase [bacterium]